MNITSAAILFAEVTISVNEQDYHSGTAEKGLFVAKGSISSPLWKEKCSVHAHIHTLF